MLTPPLSRLRGAAVLLALTASTALAQGADSTSHDEGARAVTAGVTGGAVGFASGRTEQALGAVARWHMTPWASLALAPTWAIVHDTGSLGGSASGFADLPVELGLEHAFDKVPGSPSVGLGINVNLPVGDSATGFGAGKVGYGAMLGLGVAPAPRTGLWMGAGRSLSGTSMQSALAASGTWGDAEASYAVSDRLHLSAGIDGDLGAPADGSPRSESLAGGVAMQVAGPFALTVNASHGIQGLAPRWTMAIGFGTEFANLTHIEGGTIGALGNALGHGASGLTHGNGSGSGTGHGRKP